MSLNLRVPKCWDCRRLNVCTDRGGDGQEIHSLVCEAGFFDTDEALESRLILAHCMSLADNCKNFETIGHE